MKSIIFSQKGVICLIILFALLCVSCVSATEIDVNATLEASDDIVIENLSIAHDSKLESIDDEIPDVPDLVLNDTIYITSQNWDDYFENGVLSSRYSNKTLLFSQDFENLGKLTINADNVVIKGSGFSLKNTVFELNADNITLTDLTMDLDSEFANNDGAAILVSSDYANLINMSITYIVPLNVEGYGIFASSSDSNNPIKNLKIKNCNINFEGHNDDANVYDCAVKLSKCKDSIIENNTISSSLPLKDIIFGVNGAELASDLVLTVGIEGCDNLSFIGNTLIAEVNKRPENRYPSLDCMLISKSDNCFIYNNSIYMTDFLTHPNVENYIYGLDIYNLNNLTVDSNKISIITTGGKLAAGTAYPIQMTGPISNVNVTNNDLYSFSNGPNIGVYSQNFYGATSVYITNNRINVTGLAGEHEWALVAGIESQDTNSTILNNRIEVHSVGDVSINDNIYGVSYRQSTAGDHQYNIQNNTVFSDGYYSVNLRSSVNSTVSNNLLVSYNPDADDQSNSFKYGDISSHENLEFYNNNLIKAFDYFASQENTIDNGDEFNYNPVKNKDTSDTIDGSKISGSEDKNRYNFNPLIPGSSDTSGVHDGEQGWINPNDGTDSKDGDDSQSGGSGKTNNGSSGDSDKNKGISLRELLLSFVNSNTENGQVNTTSYNGKNVNVVSNNSDATPSDEGNEAFASQSKSTASLDSSLAGESSSVSKKIYELDEKNEINKFIPSIFFIIPILILLFIGIRREKSDLE